MTARSYNQHCGLARALDLVGERWTLLVVRELALGPKRYRDLLDALPGIGTNLLAARLRLLEANEIVERTFLPPPAGVRVYALTPAGEGLRDAIEGLTSWGMRLLPERPGDSEARAAWAALSIGGAIRAGQGDGFEAVIGFEVEDERFWVHFAGADTEVRHGVHQSPDVAVSCDLPTFFALASRAATPGALAKAGRLRLDGPVRTFDRAMRSFHLPSFALAG